MNKSITCILNWSNMVNYWKNYDLSTYVMLHKQFEINNCMLHSSYLSWVRRKNLYRFKKTWGNVKSYSVMKTTSFFIKEQSTNHWYLNKLRLIFKINDTWMCMWPCLHPSNGNHSSTFPFSLKIVRSTTNVPSSSSLLILSWSNNSIRNFCPLAWSTTNSKYSFQTGFKSLLIVLVLENWEPTKSTRNKFNQFNEYIRLTENRMEH